MQVQVLETNRKRYLDLIDRMAKTNAEKLFAKRSISEV
jgi:hypothetical protein